MYASFTARLPSTRNYTYKWKNNTCYGNYIITAVATYKKLKKKQPGCKKVRGQSEAESVCSYGYKRPKAPISVRPRRFNIQ